MNIWTGIFAFVSVVILLGAFYYLGSTTSELNKRINELEEENQELDRLNSLYQQLEQENNQLKENSRYLEVSLESIGILLDRQRELVANMTKQLEIEKGRSRGGGTRTIYIPTPIY